MTAATEGTSRHRFLECHVVESSSAAIVHRAADMSEGAASPVAQVLTGGMTQPKDGIGYTMRYIFAKHDRTLQLKLIRESIEGYRNQGTTDPEGFRMHPVYDDLLEQIGDHFLGHWREGVAIIGLGGYGRMEMSPYSDVDLLFLRPEDAAEGIYRAIRDMLYLLWDAKVELGHSVRTVEECREEAEKDLAVLTSLMDARLVWGDERIFRQLLVDRNRMVTGTDPLDLYLRIEAEMRSSAEKFGHTIYLLEPNVKEGPGSLRRMQLVAWLARMVFGCSGLEDLPRLGFCGRRELEEVQEGLRFLSGIRARLHLRSGRGLDVLEFEAQSEFAQQMGFEDTPERRGVEALMREYYRHTHTMDVFAGRILARARLSLAQGSGSQVRRLKLDDAMYIGAGGIHRFDPAGMGDDPREMLRAFRWVALTGCHLDIRLGDLMRTAVRSLPIRLVEDNEANSLFLDIFRTRGAVSKAMTSMMETGFLEHFIPEFSRVRFLPQHTLYHLYTVDLHTMGALEKIDSFGQNGTGEEDALLRSIFARIDKPEVLYLAALFHDIGKGQGSGHEVRGEKIARPVLKRLGLPPEDVHDICYLIRNHLAMPQLAFKKDLHDAALVSRFGEGLMSRKRLDLLMLLTHADLMAVGSKGINSWRRMLLEELYYRTLDHLEGESAEGEDLEEWIDQTKAVIRDLVPEDLRDGRLEEFLREAPSRYLLDFYPSIVADHYTDIRSYLSKREKTDLGFEDLIVRKTDHHGPGYSAVTVIVRDRPGLFYKLAGVFSANGINILGAWSHSLAMNSAVATFHVNEIPEGPVVDPGKWDNFCSDIGKMINGKLDVDELVALRRRGAKVYSASSGPRFPLKVEVDDAVSDRATVLEVYAHDRTGLLYDITSHLSALKLDIVLTKITTEVDQVADIFYVVDEDGQKIVDFDRLNEIRDSLRDHLLRMEESNTGDDKSIVF